MRNDEQPPEARNGVPAAGGGESAGVTGHGFPRLHDAPAATAHGTPAPTTGRPDDPASQGRPAPPDDPGAAGPPDPGGEVAEPGDGDDDRRRRRSSFIAELPILVVVAFVLALLLKTFLVQAFYIPSESMLPTLAVGDRVLVNKLAHEFREPERGEVVVFTHDDGGPAAPSDGVIERLRDTITSGFGVVPEGEKDFIKRIVGMPGETIEMRDGVVYIDGVPLPESSEDDGGYLSRPDTVDFGPEEVPDGEYFMMGDNRPNSSDSRAMLDTVPEEQLVGRAFVIIWPVSRVTPLGVPDYAEEGVATSGVEEASGWWTVPSDA